MKTLILEEPGRFVLTDTQKPETLNEGDALVRVLRVGICGTDLHAFNGNQPFFSYPRILGHELAVEVVEINGESSVKPGDICAIRPYLNCGECVACRRGRTNACVSLKTLGVHQDGGMREYFTVPANLLHVAPGVAPEELALVEMLCIGAHAVRRAQLEPGENVLVIGAGPIGMGTAQFARVAGANVAIMDINPDRLAFCEEVMHFEKTVDARQHPAEQIRTAFDGELPTAVFDATGNSTSMHNAFQYVSHTGRLVFVGLFKGDITFNDPYFHSHELTIMSSRNATAEDFDHVIASLANGSVSLDGWITHEATPETFAESFPTWLDPESGTIKAMLKF